jgi:outer membrane usher protein FimD/PapC
LLPHANGAEKAILKITLNQEEKGEFVVDITEDGDFLVRVEDLKRLGLAKTKGKISVIEGEEVISLRSIEGLKVEFNEKKLSLEMSADAQLLGKKVFEMRYTRQPKVYYPKDTSGFLNYSLTYNAGDAFTYNSTVLTNQLGLRAGDFLFLTDSSYTHKKEEGGQLVRLMSSLTYDRREDLKRGVAGDFFVTSGELGSTVNMGGLSFSKTYLIDPYFIKYPEMGFSGLTSLPSELEVYRDGVLIKKERISPGGFELRDIPAYVGSGLVEIVLRDSFGREQRIKLPYYLSDILLKKGLQEYSYNIGFLRQDFGSASNHYKELSFLGFHRYGVSDSLTAGLRAEASGKVLNIGFSSTYLLPWQLGIIDGSAAWSDSKERKNGLAGSMSYLYQGRDLSFNLLLRGFNKEYFNISSQTATDKTKYEISAGAGYASEILGSFSLGLNFSKKYVGINKKELLASYSRRITNRSHLSVTFKKDLEEKNTEVTVGVNYYFKNEITASATYQNKDGASTEGVQIFKSLPYGEGFGGRASLERKDEKPEVSYNYDLQLQYNAKYGQYTGEFMSMNQMESYTFSAAGGIAFVKDSLNFTRPIQDSFALVKVGDLKDVRAYLSGQEIGRTGTTGKVWIPNLGSYYENQISINDKDIPIEYTLSEVAKYVSPPRRSGSYIEFGATKIQSFIGMLKAKMEGEIKPVEFIEFRVLVDGKELLLPTGRGGEFYLENIKTGRYKGEFKYLDKAFVFDMIIPKSDEMIVDLGEIICE